MNFLKEGVEKLDLDKKLPDSIKDKIPDEHKDKIPGQSRAAKGQGEHLSQGGKSDAGGFPNGLRPASWMGDLISKKLVPETAAVTEFRYPGSHDCATYGSGIESFSYQCQDKNLYEQMNTGQRFFDLRLAYDSDDKKFIPVHGIAKNTADDFNQNAKEAKDKDLATQILKFAKEHPSEILVFQVRIDDLAKVKQQFGDVVWNILGNRLLEAPSKGQPVPTYNEAVRSNRNIIWGVPAEIEGPISKYIWDVGGNTSCWMGAGNPKLWNEPVWQSGEISKVLASTEEFMKQNESKLAEREKFWVANLQLTPVLGQSISTFIKEGGSIRPKDLALGGGIGTHGSFNGSNEELRKSGKLETPLWKKTASCMVYDFCDTKTTGEMVAMNIGGTFSGGGSAGAGPAGITSSPSGGQEHEEGEKGRRGGGRKGGRGGDDDDDEDGPGKGRGGHGGGGGGRHHEGRGGRHQNA